MPPEVITRSHSAPASRKAWRVASRLSGTMPRSVTSQPSARSSDTSTKRLLL